MKVYCKEEIKPKQAVIECPSCKSKFAIDLEKLQKQTGGDRYNVGDKCEICGWDNGFDLIGGVREVVNKKKLTEDFSKETKVKYAVRKNIDEFNLSSNNERCYQLMLERLIYNDDRLSYLIPIVIIECDITKNETSAYFKILFSDLEELEKTGVNIDMLNLDFKYKGEDKWFYIKEIDGDISTDILKENAKSVMEKLADIFKKSDSNCNGEL